ncbi:hypothetical protein PL9214500027 [Planktothrix tepida PCC 9214]|uniref:Uncharacterized protein n=1 Tax=Planktothrix tepida PCC 9214 TaxID=671072 RepID=A0A1J1LLG8_9CYAN|nr:hypothetical protein PL9214500027 [Planktothrix tepida PCC 9214]
MERRFPITFPSLNIQNPQVRMKVCKIKETWKKRKSATLLPALSIGPQAGVVARFIQSEVLGCKIPKTRTSVFCGKHVFDVG